MICRKGGWLVIFALYTDTTPVILHSIMIQVTNELHSYVLVLSIYKVLSASMVYDILIYLVFYPEQIVSQQVHCLVEMYVKTRFSGGNSHTRINVGLQYLT